MVVGNGIGLGDSCGLRRYFKCLVGLLGLGVYGIVRSSSLLSISLILIL